MNNFNTNRHSFDPSKEENMPLDKVLKPRWSGKKIPERFSSESDKCNQQQILKKNKSIMKQEKQPKSQSITQLNSTEIAKQLILDEKLTVKQIEELLIKLKNIKSLKYDKLSDKVRENLLQVRFNKSYSQFIKIISAYSDKVGSTHLLHAIFHGFQLAWRRQRFNSIEIFDDFLILYLEKVPNCLNKRFVRWIKDTSVVSLNRQIYPTLRQRVLKYVDEVINWEKKIKVSQNEKIIGLVVYFELFDSVNMKQLVKLVPLQKINEYMIDEKSKVEKIQSENNKKSQKMEQEKGKSQQKPQKSSQQEKKKTIKNTQTTKQPTIPPLVHHSILELLSKNDLKQVQKILKSYRIPHTNYPNFVKKLQMKYLQYVERTNPIYVIDQLVHGKTNLVEGLIDIYLRKKKYDHVEHFMHKYKLRGIKESDPNKIFINPLKHQDSFGPTESHVLNQRPQAYFLRLSDFELVKSNVIWIDTVTIFQKPFTNHLKKLLYSKQISLDSESSSAIHVFQKTRLQLIQIYEPQSNIVLLFDVRDFKNDKKKRNRKQNLNSNAKRQSNNQNKNKNSFLDKSGTSLNQPIELEDSDDNNNTFNKQIQNTSLVENNDPSQTQNQKQQKQQEQNKAWFRFTKIIQNVFKNCTIYGHVLHSDLGDIISQLNLNLKLNNLKIKDSQTQFKKYFPKQTKSKLSFLTQKCFGKEISKFQQCGAWDKRPLRCAQKHYAALDAVLPYKLVKWMEENCTNK